MQAWEFEEAVWKTDGIRVVIRTPKNAPVGDFGWKIAAPKTETISWYRNRIAPLLQSVEFSIYNGGGTEPNGNSKIETVRASYN